jgi:hypothetical protein
MSGGRETGERARDASFELSLRVAVTLDTNPSFTALPEAARKDWLPLEVEDVTVE